MSTTKTHPAVQDLEVAAKDVADALKKATAAEVTIMCKINGYDTSIHKCLNTAFCKVETPTTELGLGMDLMENCPDLAPLDSVMMSSMSSMSSTSDDFPGPLLTKVVDLGKKVASAYHTVKSEKRTAEKNLYCLGAGEVLTFQKKINEMCTTAAAKHSST